MIGRRIPATQGEPTATSATSATDYANTTTSAVVARVVGFREVLHPIVGMQLPQLIPMRPHRTKGRSRGGNSRAGPKVVLVSHRTFFGPSFFRLLFFGPNADSLECPNWDASCLQRSRYLLQI